MILLPDYFIPLGFVKHFILSSMIAATSVYIMIFYRYVCINYESRTFDKNRNIQTKAHVFIQKFITLIYFP